MAFMNTLRDFTSTPAPPCPPLLGPYMAGGVLSRPSHGAFIEAVLTSMSEVGPNSNIDYLGFKWLFRPF